MSIGDVVSQLIIFVILLALLFAVYYVVRSISRHVKKSKDMEQKLDKIMEHLTNEKKNDGLHVGGNGISMWLCTGIFIMASIFFDFSRKNPSKNN